MWHREQKKSSNDPERDNLYFSVPISKVEEHSPLLANGLWLAFAVPSGGSGVSHSPLAEVARAKAAEMAESIRAKQQP
jgi:hypothetical protein